METAIFGVGKIVYRNKITNKVGIDTDLLVALIDDNRFSFFTPRLYNRSNYVFICQKVFAQALGVLIHKRGYSYEEAKNKLINYLNINKIKIIKNKEIGFDKKTTLVNELKEKRKYIKANPDDSDLEIMAIYKLADVDCIFTINSYHFEELCNYLNIHIEKPIDDVNIMLRQISRKKKYYKKKKH